MEDMAAAMMSSSSCALFALSFREKETGKANGKKCHIVESV